MPSFYFDCLTYRRVGQAAFRRASPPDIFSGFSGGPALEASLSHPTSSQVRPSNYEVRLSRFSPISFSRALWGSANFCKPSDISVSSSCVKLTSRSISAMASAGGN